MKALAGFLRRQARSKGLFGTSRPWLTVWGVLTSVRLLRRLTARKPVVERLTLKPGETIVITDLGSSGAAS